MGVLLRLLRALLIPILIMTVMRSLLSDFMRSGRRGYRTWTWTGNFEDLFGPQGPFGQGRTSGPYSGNSSGGNSGASGNFSSGDFHSGSQSPYEILGLPRNASASEIRSRYRALAQKYHPDRFVELKDPEFSQLAAQKFQAIQQAYEELRRAGKV